MTQFLKLLLALDLGDRVKVLSALVAIVGFFAAAIWWAMDQKYGSVIRSKEEIIGSKEGVIQLYKEN
jgi:hypothetical protein